MPGADSPSLSPPPPHVAGKWRSDAVRRRASTLSVRSLPYCLEHPKVVVAVRTPTMPWFSFQMRSRRDPDAARGRIRSPAHVAPEITRQPTAPAPSSAGLSGATCSLNTRREIASHHTDTGDKPRPPRTYSYAIPTKNGCSRLVGDGPYLADSTGTTSRNAQNARPSAYIALQPSCTSIRTKLRNLFVRFFFNLLFSYFLFFRKPARIVNVRVDLHTLK